MRVATAYNLAQQLAEWETGRTWLTPEQRIEQMYYCQRLRNFIFAVQLQSLIGDSGATNRFQGVAKGSHPSFANDLVITNMVFSDQIYFQVLGNSPQLGSRVNVIGTPGVYVEDFFGAGQFLPNNYLLDVTPDALLNALGPGDTEPSKALDFVPRLLQKGQTLEFLMAVDQPSTFFNPISENVPPVCVVSSVFSLCQDEPYSCPSETIVKMCEAYVRSQPRESFILDLRIEQTDFPALGIQRKYRTEPQSRPLLILGIASNISGAQIQIRDDTKQHDFTAAYCDSPFVFIHGDGTSLVAAGNPPNDLCPIWGIAPDSSDSQLACVYKWLPVPHFLEPNSELVVTLQNGLRLNAQPLSVAGQHISAGHIAFLCVTL